MSSLRMPFRFVEVLQTWGRRLAGVPALLVLTGCGNAANEQPRQILLFVTEEAGNRDVFFVQPAGRALPLVSSSSDEYPAAVSRDGVVAVVSVRDSAEQHSEQILLVRPGERPRLIFTGNRFARHPGFSPDGGHLFVESDVAGFRDIFRVDTRTLDVKRLTMMEDGAFEPAVHPDGSLIAFVASVDGNTEVFSMAFDGGNVRRLTAFHREDFAPRWSPDGEQLAFISNREGTDRIFTMNADGTGQRRIGSVSGGVEAEADIAWFPEGTRIVYARKHAGRWRLVSQDLAPGEERYLTQPDEDARFPAISPDGSWIAFTSVVNGNTDVVVMRPDGSNRRTVAAGEAAQWLPLWGR